MLEPGAIVAGKLRIERVLGAGGMGIVAVATHLDLDQLVALKVVHDEIAAQPDVVERFVREARASARLRSEHICKVMDSGRLESGAPYIVMELLEGFDLGTVIENARLPVVTAADYVLQACVGIAEAHGAGIIHRDLKPKNLFVTTRLDGTPLVKVLDFGIAKAPSKADMQLTKTTTVIGSPGYMSPEQLRSARDVDVRSDIWSLGVILYECVAGKLPFESDTLMELAVKIAMDPPIPFAMEVDAAYAAIAMRCLEKPIDRRFANVGELATELAAIVGPAAAPTLALVWKLLGGRASSSTAIGVAAASGASALASAVTQPSGQMTVPGGLAGTPPPAAAQPVVAAAAASSAGSPGGSASAVRELGATMAATEMPGITADAVREAVAASTPSVHSATGTGPGAPSSPPTADSPAASSMARGTLVADDAPAPRKRGGLIAALIVVPVVAAAAVFAVVHFGSGSVRPPSHHNGSGHAVAMTADAAVVVPGHADASDSIVPSDAAVAVVASADATVAPPGDAGVAAHVADAAALHADASALAVADAASALHADAALVPADAAVVARADAGTATRDEDPHAALAKARASFARGQFAQAIVDAQAALRLDGENTQARMLLVRAACRAGKDELARSQAGSLNARERRSALRFCNEHRDDEP
nr:protein kinase [Kofleriaceae bacterium]